jgi:hypothetical protein
MTNQNTQQLAKMPNDKSKWPSSWDEDSIFKKPTLHNVKSLAKGFIKYV